MFKHILIPTDGSELSRRAAITAIDLARTTGGKVLALNVVPPFQAIAYMAEMLAASELSYTEESIARAEGFLAEVRDLAAKAGVPCDTRYVTEAQPHQVIARVAGEQHCDLIVMGSHGWRGLNRLLLGSETQKVLLTAECPVLVCH